MGRAPCGVTSSVVATIPAEISGRAMTSSTSSGSLDDVRRPYSLRIIICRASVSRSCSFGPVSAATVSAIDIATNCVTAHPG